MKNHQVSIEPNGLLHDLQTSLLEAETMLADSSAGLQAAALGAMCARLVAARERVATAYAGAGRKIVARVLSSPGECR